MQFINLEPCNASLIFPQVTVAALLSWCDYKDSIILLLYFRWHYVNVWIDNTYNKLQWRS